MNTSRVAILLLFVAAIPTCRGAVAQEAKQPLARLSDTKVSRLPPNYRDAARQFVWMTAEEQQKSAKMPDEQLVAEIIENLATKSDGIGFLLVQLEKEPSSNLHSQIIDSMRGYWQSHPEEQQILGRHLALDLDAGVSVEA